MNSELAMLYELRQQQLLDLLARIHKDKGEYTAKVGLKKSLEDAHHKLG